MHTYSYAHLSPIHLIFFVGVQLSFVLSNYASQRIVVHELFPIQSHQSPMIYSLGRIMLGLQLK